MITVGVHEAKTHLSSLLAQVERNGASVTIRRYGRAVAELVPAKPCGRRSKVHPKLSKIVFQEDPTKPTIEEWADA